MAKALFNNDPCPGYARGQSPLKRQISPCHIGKGPKRDTEARIAPAALLGDPGARQACCHAGRYIALGELPDIHE
jgi:hypothetical protein